MIPSKSAPHFNLLAIRWPELEQKKSVCWYLYKLRDLQYGPLKHFRWKGSMGNGTGNISYNTKMVMRMRETLRCQETHHCSNRVGFNFLYFTSAVNLISCVNCYELNGLIVPQQRKSSPNWRWATAEGGRDRDAKIFIVSSSRGGAS